MAEESRIIIIGAGELGQALNKLLGRVDCCPSLWDIDFSKVSGQRPLKEIIPNAEFIFMCIPSWAMRNAVEQFIPMLKKGTIIVSFAKGIEFGSLSTMDEVLIDILPTATPFIITGGPMLAKDISEGKNAVGVFASKDKEALRRIAQLLNSTSFGVEISNDPFSVALAGVLKNIYAVSLGVADGLGLSESEKGWISAIAIAEMSGIATSLGANTELILGTAGVADFIATGYSPNSRNRTVGYEIAKRGKCDLRAEGLESLPLLMQRLGAKAESFPLLNVIKRTGIDCEPASHVVNSFFKKSFT